MLIIKRRFYKIIKLNERKLKQFFKNIIKYKKKIKKNEWVN